MSNLAVKKSVMELKAIEEKDEDDGERETAQNWANLNK